MSSLYVTVFQWTGQERWDSAWMDHGVSWMVYWVWCHLEVVVTSAPVSNLKLTLVFPSNNFVVQEFWLAEVMTSRKEESRLTSSVAAFTVLEKHWEAKCPFRLHSWQVGVLAGHFSAFVWEFFPHRVHWAGPCGTFLDFTFFVFITLFWDCMPCLDPFVFLLFSKLTSPESFMAGLPWSFVLCSRMASLCLTIFMAFSSVSSGSIWRRSESHVSDPYNYAVTQHFISKITVVAWINEIEQNCYVLFGSFIW